MIYGLIADLSSDYPILVLCKVLAVSRSSYYDFVSGRSHQLSGHDRIMNILSALPIHQNSVSFPKRYLEAYLMDPKNNKFDKIENTGDQNNLFQNIKNSKLTLEQNFIQQTEKHVVPKELTPIPRPPANFTGRKRELTQINNRLSQNQSLLLVNGLGGIGKSTVAKKYALDHYGSYDHLAWITIAQDASARELQSSQTAIANNQDLFKSLNLSFNPKMEERDRLKLITQNLQQLPGKKLLILDNAAPALQEIKDFLPQPPSWQVLITSRSPMEAFDTFPLDKLEPGEAKAFFLEIYPAASKQSDSLEELLAYIGYHTLTIELLARACKKGLSLTPEKLLTRLKNKEFDTLTKKVWSDHSGKQQEVFGYLLTAFDLSGLSERSKDILRQWSILPSLPVVSEDVLMLFDVDEEKGDNFEEALQELRLYGWLIYNENTDEWACHQMVQMVAGNGFEPDAENCKDLILGLEKLISISFIKDNQSQHISFMVWVETFLLKVEIGDEVIEGLRGSLINYYIELSPTKNSISISNQSLKFWEEKCGIDSLEYAISLYRLA